MRNAAHAPSLVDRLTPDAVYAWIPDALVDAARDDIARGRVARPTIRETTVEAFVADGARGRVRGPNHFPFCPIERPVAPCGCSACRCFLSSQTKPMDTPSALFKPSRRPVRCPLRANAGDGAKSELIGIGAAPSGRIEQQQKVLPASIPCVLTVP